jgi:hypothetical protein
MSAVIHNADAIRESRDQARRHDAAAAWVLERLRHWKTRAYRCDANDPDLWHADCPECLTEGTLLVRQTTTGRVHLACTARHGCSEQGVLRVLRAIHDHTDAWAVAGEWRDIALEARAIARDAVRALNDAHSNAPTRLRAVA